MITVQTDNWLESASNRFKPFEATELDLPSGSGLGPDDKPTG